MSDPRDGWRIECGWNLGGKERVYRDEISAHGNSGFDELVIGKWFHIERMHTGGWFLTIGGREADIIVKPNGEATVRWRDGA